MSRRKSALITGGSQGIGLACAQLLYEKGYDICLMSRSPEKLDEAARAVPPELPDRSIPYPRTLPARNRRRQRWNRPAACWGGSTF